LKSYCNNKKR